MHRLTPFSAGVFSALLITASVALTPPAYAWTNIAAAASLQQVSTVIDLSAYPIQPASPQRNSQVITVAPKARVPAQAFAAISVAPKPLETPKRFETIQVARAQLPAPTAIPGDVPGDIPSTEAAYNETLSRLATPSLPGRLPRDTVSMKTKYAPGEIVISTSDRKLYFITERGKGLSFPIAVPGAHGDKYYGQTRITKMRPAPVWRPTENTRRRIAKKTGSQLPKVVPAGHPENALGDYALNLTWPLIRIHGTNNPDEIGGANSAGCFRMYNDHVGELAGLVGVGTRVTVLK